MFATRAPHGVFENPEAERCFESEACAKQEELQADLVAARAEAGWRWVMGGVAKQTIGGTVGGGGF